MLAQPVSDASAPQERPRFGFTDTELATHPTVYRDDLLKDRTMLISGGGSGMGKATAFLAARLGANVVICGRKPEKLEAVQGAIEAMTGRRPMAVPMTIREPEMVEHMLDRVFERYGALDCVVNNAGGQFPQNAIDFSRKGEVSLRPLPVAATPPVAAAP